MAAASSDSSAATGCQKHQYLKIDDENLEFYAVAAASPIRITHSSPYALSSPASSSGC